MHDNFRKLKFISFRVAYLEVLEKENRQMMSSHPSENPEVAQRNELEVRHLLYHAAKEQEHILPKLQDPPHI